MPQIELDTPRQSEIMRVPILPDNSTAPGRSAEAAESVIRPEILTVSANGTHIDSPSAMYEVVDNHAVELSPFDLTNKVTTAATEAASKMTGMSTKRLKSRVWPRSCGTACWTIYSERTRQSLHKEFEGRDVQLGVVDDRSLLGVAGGAGLSPNLFER